MLVTRELLGGRIRRTVTDASGGRDHDRRVDDGDDDRRHNVDVIEHDYATRDDYIHHDAHAARTGRDHRGTGTDHHPRRRAGGRNHDDHCPTDDVAGAAADEIRHGL